MASDLATLADVIGGNATAALSFGDRRAAQDILNALQFKPHITLACIYTPDARPFASYPSTMLEACPVPRENPNLRHNDRLRLFHNVVLDQEMIGVMYLESGLDEATQRLRRYITTSLIIIFAASVAAYLLGTRLQRWISRPILALVDKVREFSAQQNYAVRVPVQGRDELQLLVNGFTEMLQQIQERDKELHWHYEQLNHARQAAETAALQDPLTHLPNRRLFQERLSACLLRAERNPEYLCALLFLDLDRFKIINDSLGHNAGDELLVEVARRLQACLRSTDMVARIPSNDIVARLGGDEFAILLDDIGDISNAVRVADRISKSISPPFHLRGKDVTIDVSIGITTSASHSQTAEAMLREADTAMYRAKEARQGGSVIFDTAMHSQVLERLQLESELRHALEHQEFVLHYQPIVSLADEQVVGFEALLRWQSPQRGLISPGDIIPIAEETGLIVPLGAWILREACQQVHRWQRRFGRAPYLKVNVNISATQFLQPDLVNLVSASLEEAGIDGPSLCLELTESVAMKGADRTVQMLNDLRRLGVRLSIDDFGTGYSSLNRLHRFPVETLKIDRGFVGNMETNERNLNIVKTIISMAHNLQMKVVAEGAETREQVALLRGMNCDCVQGFYYFKPLAPSDVESLMEVGLNAHSKGATAGKPAA